MSRATKQRFRKFGVAAAFVAVVTVALIAAGTPGSRADEGEDDDTISITLRADGGYLGVSTEEETEHSEGGARVTRVVEDSPADAAGILEGDIIVKIDDDVIRGPLRLRQRIVERDPGEEVEVVVIRDGKRRTLDVELGDRSEGFGYRTWVGDLKLDEEWARDLAERSREMAEQYRGWYEEHGDELLQQYEGWQEQYGEEWAERYREWAEQWKENYEDWAEDWSRKWEESAEDWEPRYRFNWRFDSGRPKLGVQLVETTPELREHLGAAGDAGVLVSKVLDDSAAQDAGVRVGDLILSVDGEEIGSAGDLVRELRDKSGETIELEVLRDGRRMTLSPAIPEQDEEDSDGPRALVMPPLPPVGVDARRVEREVRRQAMAERREALRRQVEVRREVARELQAARREALDAERAVQRELRESLRHEADRRREAQREVQRELRKLRQLRRQVI
jgi:C-terminal processing protease CtpA/Prc